MKTSTAFLSDERCLWHSASSYVLTLPVGGWVQPAAAAGHAESPETKRRLKNLLDVSGLLDRLQNRKGPEATQADLERVHGIEYLRELKRLSDAGAGQLGPGAPVGPGTYEIAKLSAGLATAAVDLVLRGEATNAYALSRPPGHHCLANEAMGFCYLANIAIAIEAAIAEHGPLRVAVIDWDVHHGNGTQSIFFERGDVLTVSLHQDGCYPSGYSGEDDRGAGAGYGANLNIPLPPGSGHNTYLYAMDTLVIPAIERFKPDLIVVACGYDANAVDPLARMVLHSDTFREMTNLVRSASERLCDGRLVMVHEGGYAESYVPFCGLATIEALSGIRTDVVDPMLPRIVAQQPKSAIEKLHFSLIDEMARKQRDAVSEAIRRAGVRCLVAHGSAPRQRLAGRADTAGRRDGKPSRAVIKDNMKMPWLAFDLARPSGSRDQFCVRGRTLHED